MHDESCRTGLAERRDVVHAGFVRMDRYFALQQAQHLELRSELKLLRRAAAEGNDSVHRDIAALDVRVTRLEERRDNGSARVT